ncbi:MAG TPA: MFS transporter, partial [Candidatus Acidoferrum sp.]|nr:MFS transporter [Candidatus Acidoferrum sp.]
MTTDTSLLGLPDERANSRNALIAGFLGWTLDAFDYFILTYVLAQVGADFHRSIVDMAATITVSLMVRPIGALIFGLMADRYGRRLPLMLDILLYSIFEVLSGLARTYRTFFVLRLLYGIAMGGEWGVGASLAMESVPTKWRGILSGLLQEGYALGNLLAAIAFWNIFPHWGWRPMFFIGGLPALLAFFIRTKVKE